MESIVWRLSEFFFLSQAMGLGVFNCIAHPKLTGVGFLKLINGICLGVLSLSLICFLVGHSAGSIGAWSYYMIFLCLVGNLLFCSEKRTMLFWVIFSINVVLFLYLLFLFAKGDGKSFAFLLSSSLMTGIVTYSMLLGHWYLVVFNLPEYLLKITLVVFWVVLTSKLLMSCWELANIFDLENSSLQDNFFKLVLLMRILWGYVITGVMSIFTWRLVNMRSTQSATGIFYAMTFFVFVGEIISVYFFLQYGFFI
ncbi:MAG: hypothetical protein OXB84_01365 [Halobacteriovoraceae bacterium]|nr:hypothetical protein [Halobacteriovoraceae bacterium]